MGARAGGPPRAGRAAALAALGALAAAAACGFLGAEPFAGTPSGDGVAPYEDLGAISVCVGDAHVVPAGQPPGGLCLAPATPKATACVLDRDCASRERCVCGQCTVARCGAQSDCGAAQDCDFAAARCVDRCEGARDCRGPGELCQEGACVGPCGSSADCRAGEVCGSSGRCVVAACATDDDCLAGERCGVQQTPLALRQPAPLVLAGGELLVYFEAEPAGGAPVIVRAVADPSGRLGALRLDPPGPVLEAAAAEGGAVGAPAPLLLDGEVALFYARGDGSIGRAEGGAEGRDLVRAAAAGPVLIGDQPWEAGRVGAPAVALDDAPGDARGVVLAYEGGGGAGIGVARSADGLVFSKEPGPALAPADVEDPLLWRAVTEVRAPALRVERAGGVRALRLWFGARGVESATSLQFGREVAIPANLSVGYAAALDGERFVPFPFNPVLDRVEAFLDHRSESAPGVLVVDGEGGRPETLLLYDRADRTGQDAELPGLAINPPRR